MHDGQVFVLAIIAITVFGSIVRQSIRNPASARRRHRRFQRAMGWGPWNNVWGRMDDADDMGDERKIQLLTAENDKLHGKVGRLEERIAVLERIATDPAERTAREIDALRDR